MGKVVLYLAMSVDGYIADGQGSVSWLGGDGSKPDAPGSYPAFYEAVDMIIMGWNTYTCEQILLSSVIVQNPPILLPPKNVCQPLSACIADGEASPFLASAGSNGITH